MCFDGTPFSDSFPCSRNIKLRMQTIPARLRIFFPCWPERPSEIQNGINRSNGSVGAQRRKWSAIGYRLSEIGALHGWAENFFVRPHPSKNDRSASFYVDRYGRLYQRGSDSSNSGKLEWGWEGKEFDVLPSLVEGCGSLQKQVRQLYSARGSFDQQQQANEEHGQTRGTLISHTVSHTSIYCTLVYIVNVITRSFVSGILGIHSFTSPKNWNIPWRTPIRRPESTAPVT